MPRCQPPFRVAPDCAPEKRIVVSVVIVTGQDEGSKLRRHPIDDQQALVAMSADCPALNRTAAHIGARDQSPGIARRCRRPVLHATYRVDPQRPPAPSLSAVE